MACPPPPPLNTSTLSNDDKLFLQEILNKDAVSTKEKSLISALPWKQQCPHYFHNFPGTKWKNDMISSFSGNEYLKRKIKIKEARISDCEVECILLPVIHPISDYFESGKYNKNASFKC